MAPLLGAVPFLIPGHIHARDEVVALNSISHAIGEHGLMELGAFGISYAGLAVLRLGQNDGAPLRSKDEVPFRVQSKHVLRRFVVHNHLPRHELPNADELFRRGRECRLPHSQKGQEQRAHCVSPELLSRSCRERTTLRYAACRRAYESTIGSRHVSPHEETSFPEGRSCSASSRSAVNNHQTRTAFVV